jgi:hypothetical protein
LRLPSTLKDKTGGACWLAISCCCRLGFCSCRVAAGPELPRQHGATSPGQACAIRNGAPLPGSDFGEGGRSKRCEAAAGDGEPRKNAAARLLSPLPAPPDAGAAIASINKRAPMRMVSFIAVTATSNLPMPMGECCRKAHIRPSEMDVDFSYQVPDAMAAGPGLPR